MSVCGYLCVCVGVCFVIRLGDGEPIVSVCVCARACLLYSDGACIVSELFESWSLSCVHVPLCMRLRMSVYVCEYIRLFVCV